MKGLHLRQLFAEDPKREERLPAEGAGVCLDHSKNRVTGETLKQLLHLAEESSLRERIDAEGGVKATTCGDKWRRERTFIMATIGNFLRKGETFEGEIKTLQLQARLRLMPSDREGPRAPDLIALAFVAEEGRQ